MLILNNALPQPGSGTPERIWQATLSQGSVVRPMTAAQPPANPDRLANEERARQLVEMREIDGDHQFETDTGTLNGTRDLRSFASPNEAGIGNGSELMLKVGDGTWVKVQFEAFQRISVTKDGITTLFSYPSAGGTWPESLVRAFNSIGGGLNASLSWEGKLDLTAEEGQAIEIAADARKGPVARPSTASALGLDQGLVNAEKSDQDATPHLGGLPPGFANAVSGVFGLVEGDNAGNYSRVRDAYAEAISLAGQEPHTERSTAIASERFAPDPLDPAHGII